ncbi:MAG: hypothetical protein HXX81_07630 [Campylobacterales bacterium]|nr:hypothetical protein [Campylobacterales bacterium]
MKNITKIFLIIISIQFALIFLNFNITLNNQQIKSFSSLTNNIFLPPFYYNELSLYKFLLKDSTNIMFINSDKLILNGIR